MSGPGSRPTVRPYRWIAIAFAVVIVVLLSDIVFGYVLPGRPSATPSPSPSPTARPTPTPSPTVRITPTPAPTPSPTAPPSLPSLLAVIGDSYTQAWTVSPAYPRDHTQFSWAIGTDPNDGVLSLVERFKALGASPAVVDAATSGMKMDDAIRQANLVAAAARKLTAGQIAYVTFMLGTNDLCDDPKTDPGAFETAARSAMQIVAAALPAGSRILAFPVPDFAHLRDVTQADPTAKAALALPVNASRCPPFLGDASTATLGQAANYRKLYDTSLEKVCSEVNVANTGKLVCTWDAAKLSLGDFTVGDLSTADWFHPSLSGQAKIAAAAWSADVWKDRVAP
jgi:lysophospholipase L1-like esterase